MMLIKWAGFLLAARLAAAFTVTADSQHAGNEASKAGDGITETFWHTEYNPDAPLPHNAVIDMGSVKNIYGFAYYPRQDGIANGRIGQYKLEVSLDKNTWTQTNTGTWLDDASMKRCGFNPRDARYIRITAYTEAGNRGPWTSAAMFGWDETPATNNGGRWSQPIAFPIVLAGAFIEFDSGNVLTFASYRPNTFSGQPEGVTYTATYDPTINQVSEKIVSNTGHDMFCPGMSMLFSGRAMITGGDDSTKTSIYDPRDDSWQANSAMKMGRGYQSQTTLSNNKVFTIGGSWSGGQGGKNAEMWDPATQSWSLLPGCPVAPMLTADAQGIFRQDNHAWLFSWKNAYVFQAGPSIAMNWYGTTGTGSQTSAGNRGNDGHRMNGNAVMYDAVAGKILTVGGAPDYQDADAVNTAYIITIGNPNTIPTVQQVASMANRRSFANGVVLPGGQTIVFGGQTRPVPFTDTTSVKNPEMYDPARNTWTTLAPHIVSRTYHSVALLLMDGRVFTGGGGLCGGCNTNHADGQIYSPPYLFTGTTRPTITAVSATTLSVGATFTATSNMASTWSLIRFGSNTHTVNTDQRRVPLTPTATSGNTYTFKLPTDAGILLPGYWMLFAMNSAGAPSIAKSIRITA